MFVLFRNIYGFFVRGFFVSWRHVRALCGHFFRFIRLHSRCQSQKSIDLSVYMVTGRDLLPPGMSYLTSLEEALRGGVTVVQVREKHADTGEFLEIANDTIKLCSKYNVPVIINDRTDIALASGAAGVHVGQSDMPLTIARKLLPPGAIIGVSCATTEEARKAVEEGADYVGLGSVYSTNTKDVSAPGHTCGVERVCSMLDVLEGTGIKAVAIGGINRTNVHDTLVSCVSTNGHALDGIAVVSDIVASPDPRLAASRLAQAFRAWAATSRGNLLPGHTRTKVIGKHLR